MTPHAMKNVPIHHIDAGKEIRLIPLDRIKVLNPRSRNKKIFARLVENISTLGLKRPITVAESGQDAQGTHYDLVCGQGRYEAFQILGEKEIPCTVVHASETDRFLISLVENLARRKHSNRDLLDAVRILADRGYSMAKIGEKTGLDPAYINCIIHLLRQGEERLIAAVEKGWLSIALASQIARSGDAEIQEFLMKSYDEGILNGEQLMYIRRLVHQRKMVGKEYGRWKYRTSKNITPKKLLKTYQNEVRRQKLMIKKAEVSHQRLLFVTTALRRLLEDENLRTLLRAENIQDMPQPLAERIQSGTS